MSQKTEDPSFIKRLNENGKEREANYKKFIENKGQKWVDYYVKLSDSLGFKLDVETGQLSYKDDFSPLKLNFSLCYVRHGQTHGNCEPRVYQAISCKDSILKLIEETTWNPELVILSPLSRAACTAMEFLKYRNDIPVKVMSNSIEMCFGSWDNELVQDKLPDDICHLFYLNQNALVKSDKPAKSPELNQWCPTLGAAENFIDVINRANTLLQQINQLPEVTAKSNSRLKIIMFGHSMIGAAISFLVKKQETPDNYNHLVFDGKHIMKHATPIILIE